MTGTITRALPFAEYCARDSVHFSTLKEMDRSPLHYRRAVDHGRADTTALRMGRVTHSLILTPEVADVAVWSGGQRRGKAWEAFKAERADATIVTESEIANARAMRAAVERHPVARRLLAGGDAEVTVEWVDERTLLPCRARVDYLHELGSVVEVKTTKAAHPLAFSRASARYLYHAQLAFYVDGLRACGVDVAYVRVIAIESAPPHDVCVYTVGEEVLDVGRRKVDGWLARVAECTASGRWPGAGGDEAVPLALPDYAMTDGLDDVDLGGVGSEEESDVE